MTLYRVKQRCKRSPLANWRSSIRHPLFKMRCHTSIPQRHAYHSTRSMASAMVSTAMVVNNSHSMGVTSVGGSTSWTWTAHSVTAGKPSRWRCRGGHRVEAVEPLLTFLLADGQVLASGALAHVFGIPGPHLLGQEAQGHTLGR